MTVPVTMAADEVGGLVAERLGSQKDLMVVDQLHQLALALSAYRPSLQNHYFQMNIFQIDKKKTFALGLANEIRLLEPIEQNQVAFNRIGRRLIALLVKEIVVNEKQRQSADGYFRVRPQDSPLLAIARQYFPGLVREVETSVVIGQLGQPQHASKAAPVSIQPISDWDPEWKSLRWQLLRNALCCYRATVPFFYTGFHKTEIAEQIAQKITELTDAERTDEQYKTIAEDLVGVISGDVRQALFERRQGSQGHYGCFYRTIESCCRSEIAAVESDYKATCLAQTGRV